MGERVKRESQPFDLNNGRIELPSVGAFGSGKFEMPTYHPSGNAKKAIGCANL